MNSFQASEYVSIALSIGVLAFAAWCDLKTREVPDKVWLVYGPIGAALTIYRVWIDPSLLILSGASIGLSILIAFGLVLFGLTGGADGKAIICLGLTIPLPPDILNPILGYFHPFFPIVVVITGYLASISVAFWMLAKNLTLWARLKSSMFEGLGEEPTWKKVMAFITGYPTQLSKLRSTFYLYPMEKVVNDENGAHRTFEMYSDPDVEQNEVVCEFEESLKKVGSPNRIWVTPGLPLLVFIFIALLIALTVGDPLFFALSTLLKR
ncbi:MAG TPA: A24 family peptidase C-terminal domain-containing protein [Candidatus Acidoferrales bacterium]|nr:A24 family peptidase C-terminal domain-containing protein [Candidatus Acidoferrales bacterium]